MREASIQKILNYFGQSISANSAIFQVKNNLNSGTCLCPVETVTNFIRHSEGKIAIFGNGGNATTAQHIALDLASNGFGAFSLPDISELTAISNDYAFEEAISIFISKKKAVCKGVIFLSVSGNSKNLVRAAKTANSCGLNTLSITGYASANRLSKLCHYAIHVRTSNYQLVEVLQHLILAAATYNLISNITK